MSNIQVLRGAVNGGSQGTTAEDREARLLAAIERNTAQTANSVRELRNLCAGLMLLWLVGIVGLFLLTFIG